MLSTLVVLSDGTQLYSGVSERNVISKVNITESCNAGTELTLGSTCASMLELSLIIPEGNLSIKAGDELTVYKISDEGNRSLLGTFTAEKPERTGANSMTITAYDHISWLDKDLSKWLHELKEWPYTLYEFTKHVCNACNLNFVNTSILNGSHYVQKFSIEGITGRQLIRWAAEVAGSFCRATATGDIEFAWYNMASINVGPSSARSSDLYVDKNNNIYIGGDTEVLDDSNGHIQINNTDLSISDDNLGNITLQTVAKLFYYQGEFKFEDFVVSTIEKVQIKQNADDIGTIYPNIAEELNTYNITGNYLLTANNANDLVEVAKNLFDRLKTVSYTPGTVTLPSNLDLNVGNIVNVTDRNGQTSKLYIMSKKYKGQKCTLESSGSASRGSSSAVNSMSYKSFEGKVLNLTASVEGLKVQNQDVLGHVSTLELDVDNVKAEVAAQKATSEVIETNVSSLSVKAVSLSATVQTIIQEGSDKVQTEFGLTIDKSAVQIHRSDSDMTNKLNELGMYIVRDADTVAETVMLKADADGVDATDVKINNYLIVGEHARFEDYISDTDYKRTACFWI